MTSESDQVFFVSIPESPGPLSFSRTPKKLSALEGETTADGRIVIRASFPDANRRRDASREPWVFDGVAWSRTPAQAADEDRLALLFALEPDVPLGTGPGTTGTGTCVIMCHAGEGKALGDVAGDEVGLPDQQCGQLEQERFVSAAQAVELVFDGSPVRVHQRFQCQPLPGQVGHEGDRIKDILGEAGNRLDTGAVPDPLAHRMGRPHLEQDIGGEAALRHGPRGCSRSVHRQMPPRRQIADGVLLQAFQEVLCF